MKPTDRLDIGLAGLGAHARLWIQGMLDTQQAVPEMEIDVEECRFWTVLAAGFGIEYTHEEIWGAIGILVREAEAG